MVDARGWLQRLAAAPAIAAAMCLLLVACDDSGPRTQVMLVVDAEPALRSRIDALRVEVRGYAARSDGKPDTASDVTRWSEDFSPVQAELGGWPHRFAIAPRSSDASRLYQASVTALDGAAPIAVLRAASGFVRGRTLQLSLRFTADCLLEASLDCEADETCEAGECRTATRPASSLPPLGSDIELPRDESVDAGVDGSMGSTSSGVMGQAGAGGEGADAGAGQGSECGNGQIDGDEACDTAIAADRDGACPTACPSDDPCQPRRVEGEGCAQRCVDASAVTDAMDGDGCCPAGKSANDDPDCGSMCGNGVVETGETCDPADTCPSEDSCRPMNVCLSAAISGASDRCNAACKFESITDCRAGDGCCPADCTRADDSDCSASCGDGVVDPSAGETCEAGSATPCLTSCDDADPCTADVLTGSAANCNTVCSHTPITTPQNGDSCCPAGANANSDDDCMARCGNRVVERGERCDGNCPTERSCDDSMACTADVLTGNECQVQCTHPPRMPNLGMRDRCCPMGANAGTDVDCAAVCGNGVVETGERCDGNCPGTADCDDDDACTADSVMGDDCSQQCAHTPLAAEPMRADGCCPMGAGAAEDADCGARCGNGMVERDEECDDGDMESGDGCSETCRFDDDSGTPGDDRRSFVHCGPVGSSMGPSCSRDQLCCQDEAMMNGFACVAPGGMCEGRIGCDGPEDCSNGQVCCSQGMANESILCRTANECTGPDARAVCHTDPSGFCPVTN